MGSSAGVSVTSYSTIRRPVSARLRDYQSTGGSQSEFCSGVGISQSTIERWGASYRRYGEAGLRARIRRKWPNQASARETKVRMLEIFHNQPSTYGINRASWTGESLAKALHRKYRVTISASTASRHLRESGYTMRRARQVLTSSDPKFDPPTENAASFASIVRSTSESGLNGRPRTDARSLLLKRNKFRR
jgi:transposase